MDSNMPCLGQPVDFNIFSPVDKAEVSVAEVEVVQGELDSDNTEGEEISGKSPIVRRILLPMNELPEQAFHECLGFLNLWRITICVSREGIILNFCGSNVLFVCLLGVCNQQLRHVFNHWTNPFAVEVVNAANLFEALEAVNVGIEDLSCASSGVGPRSLLINQFGVV